MGDTETSRETLRLAAMRDAVRNAVTEHYLETLTPIGLRGIADRLQWSDKKVRTAFEPSGIEGVSEHKYGGARRLYLPCLWHLRAIILASREGK